MARLDEVIISGTRADQPDADSVGEGTLYRVSDEDGALERSNGTTWEVTGGGAVDDLAMRILGPFTVNYNDANVLTTGVELWTPEAGYVIYNMWFETVVGFTGSGGWYSSNIVMQTANDIIYPEDGGYWAVLAAGAMPVDNGTDVARLGHADLLGTFIPWQGYLGPRWFPARMKVTTPILFKLVPTTNGITHGGTMTAGQLKMYAMVGELA